MTTKLLDNLTKAVDGYLSVDFCQVYEDSEQFLEELRTMETSLQATLEAEELNGNDSSLAPITQATKTSSIKGILKCCDTWYKTLIDHLKEFNSATNAFQKTVVNNNEYHLDLDDAYTYPLLLDNDTIFDTEAITNGTGKLTRPHPLDDPNAATKAIYINNKEELDRAITLHMLKNGDFQVCYEMFEHQPGPMEITQDSYEKFRNLSIIVDSIVRDHDLNKALDWLDLHAKEAVDTLDTGFLEIRFKLTALQFVLLLGKNGEFTLENAVNAYAHSSKRMAEFLNFYLEEISPIITLLACEGAEGDVLVKRLREGFNMYKEGSREKQKEKQFIGELLQNFKQINLDKSLFVNTAHEFIAQFCKCMKLSSESSLFQAVLAGFVNLPSFHKFNLIQLKLKNLKEAKDKTNEVVELVNNVATYDFDLPFQLLDSSRSLFKFHPIFICPVSKEQLIPNIKHDNMLKPVHTESRNPSNKKPCNSRDYYPLNPVVVLNFCHHLALKESIWELSKHGSEKFKCHYCYKKHLFSDVTDAFIIDL